MLAPDAVVADPQAEEGERLNFEVGVPSRGLLPGCEVTYRYYTEDETALAHYDYKPVRGTLAFNYLTEEAHTVEVETLADNCEEGDEVVHLVVTDRKFRVLADDWASSCGPWGSYSDVWNAKRFTGTIVNVPSSGSAGSYQREKYGCGYTGNTFGE